jgi:hypothetical protein
MPAVAQTTSRVAPTVEIAAMTATLLSFIWGWQGSFPGSWLLVVALYFGVAAVSHARRRETPQLLGLGLHNMQPAIRNVAAIVVPACAVVLATGAALDSWHFPSWRRFFSALPWMVIWATAQQYGLLCLFFGVFL